MVSRHLVASYRNKISIITTTYFICQRNGLKTQIIVFKSPKKVIETL